MRALSKPTNFNFLGIRRITGAMSILLVLASLASLATQGLNFGIDFTGGVLVEVEYPGAAELDSIRSQLSEGGFPGAVVQNFGAANDVLVRLMPQEDKSSAELSEAILGVLRAADPGVELLRIEYVGPQVGEELTINGGLALIWALGCIFLYIVLRFHWKFSAGAVLSLAHDVILTLGAFSLFRWDFDLAVLAALLAIIGYSLNDTIVVFDRCRENFRRKGEGNEVDTMNGAINEMLSRTLMTSMTTLLVVLALLFIGGEALSGFATALAIGIVIGTYSSTYVAGATSLALGLKRQDLIPVEIADGDESGARV
ncbi:MAG: protein translocase subunit SecF [Oceanococcaceae bacterium]